MDNFELDVPYETIRMASGMAIGVGKSVGRSEQKGPKDPNVVKCMGMTD